MAVRTASLCFSRKFSGRRSANRRGSSALRIATSTAENSDGRMRKPSSRNRAICVSVSFITLFRPWPALERERYRPVNSGFRFAMKASTPSRWSSVRAERMVRSASMSRQVLRSATAARLKFSFM